MPSCRSSSCMRACRLIRTRRDRWRDRRRGACVGSSRGIPIARARFGEEEGLAEFFPVVEVDLARHLGEAAEGEAKMVPEVAEDVRDAFARVAICPVDLVDLGDADSDEERHEDDDDGKDEPESWKDQVFLEEQEKNR